MPFPAAHPRLLSALANRQYLEPTPVQAAVLAEEARDRDLLVSAQTGSGKTVAFGLALAHTLLGEAPRFSAGGAPRALIVAPTRELALQVQRELVWLYAETGARIATCVGGMDPRREQHVLRQGVQIVVGTPGRLCDHLDRGALVLSGLEAIVLDEADEMLDMGFREDLERLLEAAPAERRTLLFSATIPKPIATLAKRYQKQALRVATSSEAERHHDIEYRALPIVPRERDLAVVNVLRYHEAAGALVFCATRDGVAHLAANLAERGFPVVALSGDFSQRERNTALQALRDGRARVCVATDVAARGLDLPDLGLVIHADLPQNQQVLVHRSGRTGRAGRHGVAIILVPDPARRHVERMLQAAHVDATWSRAPTADEILARDRELVIGEISSLTEELSDDDLRVARALLEKRPAEELVAQLVRLQRQKRPTPEDLTPPPSERPRREARPEPARPQSARPHREPREPRKPREHRPGGEAKEQAAEGSAWFTINIGRSKNADPKWLIPLLCRRGNIAKGEIGKIQILMRETRVEIRADASARFARSVREPDERDRNIHIEPLDA